MGVNFPNNTLLLVQLNMKETTQDTIIKGKNNSKNESIWKQTSMEEEQEAINKAKAKNFNRIRRRRSNSLMKKRSKSAKIEVRISTLRNLVPSTNNDDDNNGGSVRSLELLFSQTADYILSLQKRVRLMKTFVDVLSGSSSSNDHE